MSIAPFITEEVIFEHIDECLTDLGVTGVKAKELVAPVLGYGGIGYDVSSDEELGTISCPILQLSCTLLEG